ncbi:hypothetical protein K402DRAFT_334772 [Aulographum hederae CBS 113979]|uniref:Zn(2)-C6 fungal-type domain-containing protein n=1 Tax=Aulographum hederae CBS 113979 TaxID=1176131 RepID=A0A6G1GX21_9PEZI|nr:hypothetical protein K402DRAFT_334772 [Aulographum hederae CBS 113979]
MDAQASPGGGQTFVRASDSPAVGTPRSANADKQDNAPVWSELKTKAGKDRKRLPLACIACRRKKIRCSGEKPTCKHCVRARIPCVYKITSRKATPRTDYMAMLDKRLKRMEERVIRLIPKDHVDAISLERAAVKPQITSAPNVKSPATRKRPAYEAFGADLDEWAKSKSGDASAANRSARASLSGEENKFLTEGTEHLPSTEIQKHLAEVYFDNVYGQAYHLLHKPSFMRKLDAGTIPPVLILTVCAVAARFSTHPQIRTEPAFLRGETWASAARAIALKRYDTPNITILICYLLLGLHEFGTCQGGRSWMLCGMAQRMAFALQLHKELDDDSRTESISPTDREIRCRTMWSCFMMDRFNSSGTDRPQFLYDRFIKIQLPIKETYFQMEVTGPTEDLEGHVQKPTAPDTGQLTNPKSNMGCAAFLVRAVSLWGRLVRYLNLGDKEKDEHDMWTPESTFAKLKTAVERFKKSLPDDLRFTPENLQNHNTERTANQFIFMHIVYHQTVLFMNRFALPSMAGSRPPENMPQQFLTEAARAALDSANQISLLVKDAMDHMVVAPFAGYAAFFASTVHIHGVFSKNPRLEAVAKQYLAYNIKYLSKMKKYWGMFHFVAENLKDLYRQHADSALRGISTAPKDGSSNIFQYGDWFDRYPRGVSQTDFEDPATAAKKDPGADAVLSQKSDLQSVDEFFSTLSPKTSHRKAAANKKRKANATTPLSNDGAPSIQSQPTPPQDQSNMPQNMVMDPATSPYDTNSAIYAPHNFPFTAFPPGMAMPGQGSPMAAQLDMLSALDRQMVLDSYATGSDLASMGPENTIPPPQLGAAPAPGGNGNADPRLWSADAAAMGYMNNGNGGGGGSAWFLPFNMEPPSLEEETDIFGQGTSAGYGALGFDLGLNGFGGGGGGGGVPPQGTQG